MRHVLLGAVPLLWGCLNVTQRPTGLNYRGESHSSRNLEFPLHSTCLDDAGNGQVSQQILDLLFDVIDQARQNLANFNLEITISARADVPAFRLSGLTWKCYGPTSQVGRCQWTMLCMVSPGSRDCCIVSGR